MPSRPMYFPRPGMFSPSRLLLRRSSRGVVAGARRGSAGDDKEEEAEAVAAPMARTASSRRSMLPPSPNPPAEHRADPDAGLPSPSPAHFSFPIFSFASRVKLPSRLGGRRSPFVSSCFGYLPYWSVYSASCLSSFAPRPIPTPSRTYGPRTGRRGPSSTGLFTI